MLGAVLFLLYRTSVITFARRHDIGVHSYADDNQLYQHSAAKMFRQYSKTGVLHWQYQQVDVVLPIEDELGTRQQLAKINCKSIKINGCDIPISNQATCLGVLVDDEMTFAAHIRRLTGRCFYQLRQLRTVRRALTVEAARSLVHAFIISHVDYCNSVFGSTSAVHLCPLQSVLNTAARLIVRKLQFDRITASIRDELYWLPVLQRYHYKLCLLVNAYIGQRRHISSISVYRS